MLPIEDGPASEPTGSERALTPLDLVIQLCDALADEGVRYCHWKSNEAIDRSASGDNDLDLLVDRSDAGRLGAVLHRLGFKEARPEGPREVPGLIDHYGLDAASGRLVHLQAHYQLVLGDDMTKNFRLPVEAAYLRSGRTDGLFPLPSPDFELALFVVRMVLKHASWDAQLTLQGGLSASEQLELAYLRARVPLEQRLPALLEHLPFLTRQLAEDCLGVVGDGASRQARAAVARSLEQRLELHSRRPRPLDVALRTGRRAGRLVAHLRGHPARKRLVSGGTVVGVVGRDSSVSSPLVDGLVDWLGSAFVVRRFDFDDGYDDRANRRTYASARRHGTNGDIAICHRFPASATGGQGEAQDLCPPDLLLELVVPGGEAARGAVALDGSRSGDAILAAARRHVWAGL